MHTWLPALMLLSAVAGAQEATLKVGDAAPPLSIARWVKEGPVALEKGKVYVVEFWTMSSMECLLSLPQLSELQEAYKGKITFVGVAVDDGTSTLEALESMVQAKGPGIGYAVAWDQEGKTLAAWMRAAGAHAIPWAFIVDATGKIAFAGPPRALDLPLAWIARGTWDPAKSPAEMGAVYKRAQEIFQMDRRMALAALPAFEKEHPELVAPFARRKLELLVRTGRKEAADALGTTLFEKAARFRSEEALNDLAWFLVDPQNEIADRHLGLALKAATKAVELSKGEDGAILDTLARVHYWQGDLQKAIEVQKQAVEKAKGDPQMLVELMDTLDQYAAEAQSRKD